MCISEFWFNSLIIAASVVVLPLPVAPVTMTESRVVRLPPPETTRRLAICSILAAASDGFLHSPGSPVSAAVNAGSAPNACAWRRCAARAISARPAPSTRDVVPVNTSYVAGSTPLNLDATRYSGDIDVFHDREERVARAASEDASVVELDDVAGICNVKGNIVGLMPHPERASEELLGGTDGARLFKSFATTRMAMHGA